MYLSLGDINLGKNPDPSKQLIEVNTFPVVLAPNQSNQPVVRVWTAITGPFGSRPVPQPDPLTVGGPHPDPYPSSFGFCRVWLHPSVPILVLRFRFHVYGRIQICYCQSYHIDISTAQFVIDVLAALMLRTTIDTCPTTSWKWETKERQWLLVMYLE